MPRTSTADERMSHQLSRWKCSESKWYSPAAAAAAGSHKSTTAACGGHFGCPQGRLTPVTNPTMAETKSYCRICPTIQQPSSLSLSLSLPSPGRPLCCVHQRPRPCRRGSFPGPKVGRGSRQNESRDHNRLVVNCVIHFHSFQSPRLALDLQSFKDLLRTPLPSSPPSSAPPLKESWDHLKPLGPSRTKTSSLFFFWNCC